MENEHISECLMIVCASICAADYICKNGWQFFLARVTQRREKGMAIYRKLVIIVGRVFVVSFFVEKENVMIIKNSEN